jgi:hypothetical protein
MIIRPLKPADRAGWEPLWQGYLRFYETRLAADVTDLTFARLTGGLNRWAVSLPKSPEIWPASSTG